MAKRVNGTGSVAQIKDGRWVAAVTIDGKRVYRYRRSRKEAELALAALLSGTESLHRVMNVVPESPDESLTVRQWYERWIASCQATLRPSTCHAYGKAMRRVLPLLGEVRLKDVRPSDVVGVVGGLSNHGPRAAQESFTVFRTCLRAAVDLELLTTNPMEKVTKPRWEPMKRDFWAVTHLRAFVAHAAVSPLKWAPLCLFLATTGVRISEAAGLRWKDVDLSRGQITIREAVVFVDGTPISGPTKTVSGKRRISLDQMTLEMLTERSLETNDDYVFRTSGGRPPTPSMIRQTLLKLCEEAGVPPIHPHGLRHVHAMVSLQATRDIYLVQRRLGHANVNVTLGIYGYSPDDDHTIAAAWDGVLGDIVDEKPPSRE